MLDQTSSNRIFEKARYLQNITFRFIVVFIEWYKKKHRLKVRSLNLVPFQKIQRFLADPHYQKNRNNLTINKLMFIRRIVQVHVVQTLNSISEENYKFSTICSQILKEMDIWTFSIFLNVIINNKMLPNLIWKFHFDQHFPFLILCALFLPVSALNLSKRNFQCLFLDILFL